MKTERRHELQTNVLADWLGRHIESLRPYSKLLAGGAVTIIVVACVAAIISSNQSSEASAGWRDYFAAFAEQNPDRLRTVAEDHSGTLAALWAIQAEADIELARGIRAVYTNRDDSKEALDRAIQLYEQVEKGARRRPMLLARAQYGIAQAYESSADIENAKEAYEKIITADLDPAVVREAKQRLDALSDAATVKWYNWFSRQTPRPRSSLPIGPGGLDIPDLPTDLSELPDRPDLSAPGLPSFPDLSTPPDSDSSSDPDPERSSQLDLNKPSNDGAESSQPAEPPATEPPATEPPATEPPATEPPATEPPATEPPATEPPATEPPATEPPATEPPATEPPATEPPATEPPATEPPASL